MGAQWIEEFLEDNGQAFILCHDRPHDVVVIWHIVAEKGSVRESGALLFMFFCLTPDRFFFIFGTFCQIQLITEIEKPRCLIPRVQGRGPSGLVIRSDADMGSDHFRRIDQAEAGLDQGTVECICVVACPVLGYIVQHTWIKSGAPLEQPSTSRSG